MKSQFIIALLPFFLATALTVPTSKRADPVEVCTEATDGEPCIVLEVDGSRVAGRCVFDLVTRSCFPLLPSWFGIERAALTRLDSSSPVDQSASSNRFRVNLLEGVAWRNFPGGRKGEWGGYILCSEFSLQTFISRVQHCGRKVSRKGRNISRTGRIAV